VGAKQSTLVSHVPDAIRNGAEIRDNCMVARINLGKDGLVSGVTYYDSDGQERRQRAIVLLVWCRREMSYWADFKCQCGCIKPRPRMP
jgi:hypothetical protein